MAKWAEGGPRWLVKERPDATNVNNWHWTEKNAADWSKEKITELMTNARIETDIAHCEISDIVKCEGDAVVNILKSKIMVFFEWALEMKWNGALVYSDTEALGTIVIPFISEEIEMKDADIEIKLETSGSVSEILKDVMLSTGNDVIRERLNAYVHFLKKDFSEKLLLSIKDAPKTKVVKPCDKIEAVRVTPVKTTTSKCLLETCDYKTIESFKCSADELYRALTEQHFMAAFTKRYCIVETKVNGKFRLFGGSVQGYFVKLEPYKTIHMKWRYSTWPAEHYSEVKLDIGEKDDCSELHFEQLGVPINDYGFIREGWQRFYWESMKRTLGF